MFVDVLGEAVLGGAGCAGHVSPPADQVLIGHCTITYSTRSGMVETVACSNQLDLWQWISQSTHILVAMHGSGDMC